MLNQDHSVHYVKKTIPIFRNIPIISYILQLGKCHNCKSKISLIYPSIEIIVGFIWMFSFLYFNNYGESIYFSFIASLLIAVTIIDYKHFIIPIETSLISFLFITIYLCTINSFSYHLIGLMIGAGYLSIILIITWLITKRQGLGFGDIQLVVILGYWLGDYRILLVIFFSALVALLFWLIITYYKGYDKDRPLPFGSFLSIMAILIYPIKINFLDFL